MIVVHDYSGHPGQAQLSRVLAQRGFEVTHQHCPSYTTGKGSLQHEPGDPNALTFEPCAMEGTFAKYSPVTRVRQEVSYGRRAAAAIAARDPAVAVISNVPLLAHSILARRLALFLRAAADGLLASGHLLRGHRLGGSPAPPGRRLADRYGWRGAPGAHHRPSQCGDRGDLAHVPREARRLGCGGQDELVVPNWAPIDELLVRDADNEWRRRAWGLRRPPHRAVLGHVGPEARPEHPGADRGPAPGVAPRGPGGRGLRGQGPRLAPGVEARKGSGTADNLVLLDFQPYEDLPAVMGSADVLLAVLEPDASRFSVPSKVLTYLCSARAIVGVLPPDNAVAEILTTQGAGRVVCRDGVASEVAMLLDDEVSRRIMGWAGRRYAERAFSPETAADRFLEIFGDRAAVPVPSSLPTPVSATPDRRLVSTPSG